MRIVLAGGGTGGHLFPGIALAQGLRTAAPMATVSFFCTDRALDGRQLSRYGLSSDVLPAPRLGGWKAALAFPFAFFAAVRRAGAYLDENRPDIVVALGGYGGAPAVRAAAARGIPTVLLEQNVIPGRANRYLARRATRILTQWPESVARFGRRAGKVEVTGNPVREEIVRRDAADARQSLGLDPARRTLLVMGGSQGAQAINRAFAAGEGALRDFAGRLQVVHLAGGADAAEALRGAYGRAGIPARVDAFSDDMPSLYGAADFAVSRAGGTSIAELAAMGIPAALIPFPHAAENHQWYNAQAAAAGGGAFVVEEAALAAELKTILERAAGPAEPLAKMAERMKALGRPEARRECARRVLELGRREA